MTERKMDKLLKDVNTFDIMEMWVTDDVRPGRAEEKWLNMILRKNRIVETNTKGYRAL